MFIKKVLNKIRRTIKRFFRTHFNNETFLFCKPEDYIFDVVKEGTYETNALSEVFNISERITYRAYSSMICVFKIDNAIISSNSDVVITPTGVLWDKKSEPTFPKTYYRDHNVIDYGSDSIKIKKIKRFVDIKGDCFSMLGVHGDVWSHFIIQFAAKLYMAYEKGILNADSTIILPHYKDGQLKKVVYDFIQKIGAKVFEAEETKYYRCEKLFYIPTTTWIPNFTQYFIPQDVVMPSITKQLIYKYLVKPYSNKYPKSDVNLKLFLVRRSTYRQLLNCEEIETFFRNRGFIFVEPHKMTFEEKVSLFERAEYIVGPYSSAFSNVIWCQKGTKVLMLSCFPRVTESVFEGLADIAGVRLVFVTGDDLHKNDPHTSFSINVKKIAEAYEHLLEKTDC